MARRWRGDGEEMARRYIYIKCIIKMIQYLSIVFLWSIMHYIQSPMCLSFWDVNFLALIACSSIDSLAHMLKAYRTLRAEYHLVTGQPLSDCFLYIWPLLQLFKKLNIWLGLSLLISVSPVKCIDNPLLGCLLLLVSIIIQHSSKRLRKWWLNNHYESLSTSDRV